MLNQDFCVFLEYEISKKLKASTDELVRGFWCDGILLPKNQGEYSEKNVNNKRKIILTAFIGNTGQDKFEITLQFGKGSLSKYARGLDIIECLKTSENENWLEIDALNKKGIVRLA